jgi:inosine-uridine nucleoside N-ribohydrolase
VTLLSLAPLTDTAELLDDPLVKTKLEALFVMGGAVGVREMAAQAART